MKTNETAGCLNQSFNQVRIEIGVIIPILFSETRSVPLPQQMGLQKLQTKRCEGRQSNIIVQQTCRIHSRLRDWDRKDEDRVAKMMRDGRKNLAKKVETEFISYSL